MSRRRQKKAPLPDLNATAARHRQMAISWHGWGFNRRAHARLSHRHYLSAARHAETPAQHAAALAAAAVWRRLFSSPKEVSK